MKFKKITTAITIVLFTSSLLGCSQNATNAGTTSAGSSQMAGAGSQVSKALIRVAIGLAIGAVISKAVKKKTEDTIEDTIRDTLTN